MKTIPLLFALLCSIHYSIGQWTPDTHVNTLVVDSAGSDLDAVSLSDGSTAVVFWESVSAPVHYELRLQVLDVDGHQQLGNDGVLISNTIPMSTHIVVWSLTVDSDDNIYIGVTGTSNNGAYGFKVDKNGNHLWNSNGINVGTGNVVRILPLSSGDAIISWYEGPAGLMQKFSSAGNAIWPNPIAIEAGGGSVVPADGFEMSDGGHIRIFHKVTFGINSNLFAQRYNSNGVAQWTNPTQLATLGTQFIKEYSGTQDGDVVYYGYSLIDGMRFDSFLQRINPDGSLPWGVNGVDFDTNQTNYEMETSIAFEPSSNYLWAICTYTDTSQGQKGEYVQKFDKTTGERQFTNNAKMLFGLSNEPKVHDGDLRLLNNQPFFVIRDGFDNGASPVTLHVVYLDENGDFAWQEETKPVATYEAAKSRTVFTQPVNGQSVAVFIEHKNGYPSDRIFAQNIVEQVASIHNSILGVSLSYTNPITEVLKLECNAEILKVEISDINGKIIFQASASGNKSLVVPTENWASGSYFLFVETTLGDVRGIKLVR